MPKPQSYNERHNVCARVLVNTVHVFKTKHGTTVQEATTKDVTGASNFVYLAHTPLLHSVPHQRALHSQVSRYPSSVCSSLPLGGVILSSKSSRDKRKAKEEKGDQPALLYKFDRNRKKTVTNDTHDRNGWASVLLLLFGKGGGGGKEFGCLYCKAFRLTSSAGKKNLVRTAGGAGLGWSCLCGKERRSLNHGGIVASIDVVT